MHVSENGKDFIARHEGVVTKAYRDVAGVWTIGVGHTAAAGGLAPKSGMVISRQRAMDIFSADLVKFEKRVLARMGDKIRQHVLDFATSFDFNTGRIHNASWVAPFLVNSMTVARNSFMRWVNAGGRSVQGLVNRRNAEWRVGTLADYGTAGFIVDTNAVKAKLKTLGFDQATYGDAIRAFQAANNLVVDGTIGPATSSALDRRIAEHNAKIVIPMTGGAGGAVAGGNEVLAPEPTVVDTAVSGGGTFATIVLLGVAIFFAWHFRGPLLNHLKGKNPMALVIALLLVTGLAVFVALRHDWNIPATLTAFATASVLVWQALQALWG